MFKFRLEKILGLKEKIEEAKKNEYGKAKKKLDDAIAKKNALIAKKDDLINEMKSFDGNIEALKKRNEYYKYIDYLKEVIAEMEIRIEMLRKQAEEKRHELEEAMKERKILDKYKENEFDKYKKEELRIENGLVDELVSYKYSVKEEV